MSASELDMDSFRKALEETEKLRSKLSNNKNLRHNLISYREGDLNNHEVVIITLRNVIGAKTYITPSNSQLAKRCQYYWINGIKETLEEGLNQSTLVLKENFVEMKINGENYQVEKKLI
jgi:hypothetical protein